jgi:hypothetical protein
MHRPYLWLLPAVLALHPLAVQAADLSKIERTVGKEPVYQKKPKYCLVVFGPEAETRVWLVLDGETLYVDRNGDGDLTARDKRVPKQYLTEGPVFQTGPIPARQGDVSFSLKVDVQLRVGAEDTYDIWCRPQEGKGFLQRTHGILLFADKPQEAPIVHFGGPLTLTILDWHRPLQPRQLVRGDKPNELSILVGTPVFGGKYETFATYYEGFRDVRSPDVEVEFPGKEPGARPLLVKAAVRH